MQIYVSLIYISLESSALPKLISLMTIMDQNPYFFIVSGIRFFLIQSMYRGELCPTFFVILG